MVDSVESARDRDFLRNGIVSDGHAVPHAAVKVHLHAFAVQAGACAGFADVSGDDGQRRDGGSVPFAVMVALRSEALRDETRFMVGNEMGEVFDFLRRKAANGSCPLRRLGNHVIARAHDVIHVR